jgi:hypothetical protein
MQLLASRPTPSCAQASKLFCQNLLQHVLVETEIRHQLLELGVFLSELPQLSDIADTHPGISLLPVVKCSLVDSHLMAQSCHALSLFMLLERVDDLLRCVVAFFHVFRSVD